jgi:hypothetical protein
LLAPRCQRFGKLGALPENFLRLLGVVPEILGGGALV